MLIDVVLAAVPKLPPLPLQACNHLLAIGLHLSHLRGNIMRMGVAIQGSGLRDPDYERNVSVNKLILIVSPHIRRDGTKHPNAFDARLADSGEVLCTSERPFFDGARALLKAGRASPDDMLVMRHAGSDHDALRAKVGVAAGLTIEETGFGPKRRKYKPRPTLEVPPSIDESAPLVPVGPSHNPSGSAKVRSARGKGRGKRVPMSARLCPGAAVSCSGRAAHPTNHSARRPAPHAPARRKPAPRDPWAGEAETKKGSCF